MWKMTAIIKEFKAVKIGDDDYAIKLTPKIIEKMLCGHPFFAQEEYGSKFFRRLFLATTIIDSDDVDIPINFIELSDERYTKEEVENFLKEFYLTQLKGGAVKNGEKNT